MKSKSTSSLKALFLDQIVVFYLKDLNIATFDEEGNDMQINAITDGFVVDIDDEFFYLGDGQGNVEKVISRTSVAMLEKMKMENNIVSLVPTEDEVH